MKLLLYEYKYKKVDTIVTDIFWITMHYLTSNMVSWFRSHSSNTFRRERQDAQRSKEITKNWLQRCLQEKCTLSQRYLYPLSTWRSNTPNCLLSTDSLTTCSNWANVEWSKKIGCPVTLLMLFSWISKKKSQYLFTFSLKMKDSQVLPLIWWQEDMLDSPDEVILGRDGVQQTSSIQAHQSTSPRILKT